MKKYLVIGFIVILIAASLFGTKLIQQLYDGEEWTYILTEDQEAYLIASYLGDNESIILEETYQGKPIIEFSDDFYFAGFVKSVTFSVNLETLNVTLWYIQELIIPIDSKLKEIGCNVSFSWMPIDSLYIPKDTTVCMSSLKTGRTIESVTVHPDNPYYKNIDGVLFNSSLTELLYFPPMLELTEYTIPSTVTTITESAFYEQGTLESLYISETVTTIGDYAFGRSEMEEVIFSPFTTITNLGYGAFYKTRNLTHFDVPDSVTELISTFNNSDIETVAFGEDSQLNTIGGDAFVATYHLNELELPSSLSTFWGSPFSNSYIERLIIQSDITSLDHNTFSGMISLKSLTIHEIQSNLELMDGVLTIDEGKEIILYVPQEDGAAILNIDERVEVFDPSFVINRYGRLDSIHVHESNTTFKSVDGVLYSFDLTCLLLYPFTSSNASYEVLEGTTEIVGNFYWTVSLKEIIIPESVSILPDYVFANSSIEHVIFDGVSSLEVIPYHAFHMSKIEEIIIPKSVHTIEREAFFETLLHQVEFESGSLLETIQSGAFLGTLLTSVILPENDLVIESAAFWTSTLLDVYIPLEVTHITNAFSSYTEITFFLESDQIISTLILPRERSVILFNQSIEDFLDAIAEDQD